MRGSPLVLFVASLLCLILVSIHTPPILYVFWPAWPVILIFMILSLGYANLVWYWIWALGLILDSMQHHILGTHIISLSLIIILLGKYFDMNQKISLLQSMIMMGFASLIYLLSIMCLEGHEYLLMQYIAIFGQTVASSLLWPWIYAWLINPRKKYRKMI